MTVRHDPEIEHYKRSINLVGYAMATGYRPCPGRGDGFLFLEHPSGDRIVVTRTRSGYWLYASANAHEPGPKGESSDHATQRLRGCIAAAIDKGSIVDFVLHRDRAARGEQVSLERVRDRLREYRQWGLPLDFDGPLARPSDLAPIRPVLDRPREDRPSADGRFGHRDVAHEVSGANRRVDPRRRRYNGMPTPTAAREMPRGPRGRSPERGR